MEWNYKCNLIFPIETKTTVNITFTAVFYCSLLTTQ